MPAGRDPDQGPPAAGWLVFGIFVLCFGPFCHAGETQTVSNTALNNLHWQDMTGSVHYLRDSHGQPRILHFWAAWCIPCRTELPEMIQWQNNNSDILVIPLSLDERIAQTGYFIKKHQLDIPALLLDQDSSAALKIPALPYTIFISASGSLSGHFYGIAPWQDAKFSDRVRQHFADK
jgi:thiol-disulfide isomerase/thioredoxin